MALLALTWSSSLVVGVVVGFSFQFHLAWSVVGGWLVGSWYVPTYKYCMKVRTSLSTLLLSVSAKKGILCTPKCQFNDVIAKTTMGTWG